MNNIALVRLYLIGQLNLRLFWLVGKMKEIQLLRLNQIHLFSSLITLVLLLDTLLVQHILQHQLKTGMMSKHWVLTMPQFTGRH